MKVIIVGCGRVGSRLAATLALRSEAVTVVDPDPAALAAAPAGPRVQTVQGDGCTDGVLLTAGIETADGLAAVTGSDEVNAVVARLAGTLFSVPKVVARIYDPAKAEIYRRLGIQTIAPVVWGSERLAELLSLSEPTPVASLGGGQVEVVDATVPGQLHGRPAAELTTPGETAVIAVTRHGRTILLASPDTVLEAGDVVHVAVIPAAVPHLERLLGRQ